MSIDPSLLQVPPPTPTGETLPFWEAARRGELLLQHCADCERWIFYPRALCPHCWSERIDWRPASGLGTVRSFTIVHKPGHPAWGVAAPYPIAALDLAEGPRMLTALLGIDPADVRVGLPVRVRFEPVGDWTLPFFEPDPDRAGA
jgi:uncharacterized protein